MIFKPIITRKVTGIKKKKNNSKGIWKLYIESSVYGCYKKTTILETLVSNRIKVGMTMDDVYTVYGSHTHELIRLLHVMYRHGEFIESIRVHFFNVFDLCIESNKTLKEDLKKEGYLLETFYGRTFISSPTRSAMVIEIP